MEDDRYCSVSIRIRIIPAASYPPLLRLQRHATTNEMLLRAVKRVRPSASCPSSTTARLSFSFARRLPGRPLELVAFQSPLLQPQLTSRREQRQRTTCLGVCLRPSWQLYYRWLWWLTLTFTLDNQMKDEEGYCVGNVKAEKYKATINHTTINQVLLELHDTTINHK